MTRVATAEWRRLDQPGTDRCTLFREAEGWRLTGAAEFGRGPAASRLSYDIVCGADWQTLHASIAGDSEGQPVALRIENRAGQWHANGAHQPQVDDLPDLDLYFTPATNTLPIRRLDLDAGEVRETSAAWLTPDFRLAPLRQSYRRDGAGHYGYASPDHDFSARLTVHPSGLVIDYPGLWTGEVRDG